jgi:hypothetical protein
MLVVLTLTPSSDRKASRFFGGNKNTLKERVTSDPSGTTGYYVGVVLLLVVREVHKLPMKDQGVHKSQI